jgi:hypothetical protein
MVHLDSAIRAAAKCFLSFLKMKRYHLAIGVILIVSTLIVLISLSTATPSTSIRQPISMPSIKAAGNETQFSLHIAYSYVGPRALDASYNDKGVLMNPVTLNPSCIIFNVTRIAGVGISSCDAVMEVYDIRISTDNGVAEKACYLIGTNYKPSFSNTELSALFENTRNLTSLGRYSVIIGEFEFNMTDKPHISHPVGSYGSYSTALSSQGLWTAGKPSAVSVSVQRIGYITISNGLVTIYKDATPTNVKAMAQLSNYQEGFIQNNLIPEAQLSQKDLFQPYDLVS